MRYTVTCNLVQVIGTLWMPGVTAAHTYELSAYDMGNMSNPMDRESVERWIDTHCGDFQHVSDFRADFDVDGAHIVHEWSDEDSEVTFNDCMYGDEDEDENNDNYGAW